MSAVREQRLLARLRALSWIALTVWTVCIAASYLWSRVRRADRSEGMARLTARLTLDRDRVYREWLAGESGPRAEGALASAGNAARRREPPCLVKVTSSVAGAGQVSPIRFVGGQTGPGTAPVNDWETAALLALQQGADEVGTFEQAPDGEHFRLMRPVVADGSCARCHDSEPFRAGKICGGISVSVPLATLRAEEQAVSTRRGWAHAGLWLVGLTGLGVARRGLARAIRARERAASDLHREVMERRVMEERLREVNDRYELVLAGSNTGIWDWDVQRDKVVYSSRWKTMRGFSEDEIGDSLEEWSNRIHPEDAPRVVAAVRAHFAGQTPSFAAEYRVQRKDGAWMWIADHGLARRDSEGRVVRMAGSETDITAARQAVDLIRERESELKLVTDAVPALISYVGPDLRYRRVNRGYERWFGVQARQITGKTVREVIGEEAWKTVQPWLEKAIAGQPTTLEQPITHPNGSHRWVAISYVPDLTETGQVRGVVAHIVDITERRQAEEQLRQSAAELQAANASLRASQRAALNLMDDALTARQNAEQVSVELRQRVGERERVEEALRRSHARLDILARTASDLLATNMPQAVVERLCRRVLEALDCQFFFNYLVDEPSQRLHLNACAGPPPEALEQLRWLDFGQAVCGCAARDGQCIIAENILETPDSRTALVQSYGIQAYACHPLLAQGKVIGTLSFGTSTRTRFNADELSLMRAVTDQVAIAMQRQQGEEKLRQANADLEHRVAERTVQLATAAGYTRSLLEASIDALIAISPAGTITDVNQATEVVTGIPRCRLIGSCFPDHFTEPQQAQAVCERVLARGMVRDFQLTISHASGRTIDVLLNATVYRNQAGEVQGVFLAAHDLTERRAAERERQTLREELERVSRITTAGQLAAALAHELNQPLAAVACNVQAVENLLARETPDFVEIKEALTDIASDSQRAGAIIHQLRGLYQKTGGGRSTLALNEVLRKTLELLHSQLLFKDVALHLELDPGDPTVSGNTVELQQVVLNLVTNALDAMAETPPPARRLRIRTAADQPGQVRVSIRDTGTGLAPQQLHHLFEPFYTTKESGMGMGLAICRSIVEAHDGRLWAENNVERGATFHFVLPARSRNGS